MCNIKQKITEAPRWNPCLLRGGLSYAGSPPGGATGKEPARNAGAWEETPSIPGRHGNPPQCSACRIPWTEEPGRPPGCGREESDAAEAT